MRSLKIVNGDISFDSLGKLQWVEDINLIIQSLNLRLKTELGELFYNEEYGHPIFKGKITEESLTIFLKETLFQDERVFDVEIVEFIKYENSAKVTILIQLDTSDEIRLIYNL